MKKAIVTLLMFLGVATAKNIGLSYEQIKNYTNADFKQIQSKYNMPDELNIDSKVNNGAVFFDNKAGVTF